MTSVSDTELENLYGPLGREIWVFGYGSLMWRPDFSFVEDHIAELKGYHRALCHYSVEYRGTVEKPGLVLGLDSGGTCTGRAFRVAPMDAEEAIRAMHAREMLRDSYAPHWLNVTLIDGRAVRALAYVMRKDHELYAGVLPLDRTVELVLAGQGQMGTCLEYVENTVAHLDAMGIRDEPLHKVIAAIERVVGQSGK